MVICRALLKYGYSKFSLEILEYCDPENCVEREQYYLDLFPSNYNSLSKAGSSLGFKHSEDTLAKLRLINKGANHPMYVNQDLKELGNLCKN